MVEELERIWEKWPLPDKCTVLEFAWEAEENHEN
jgi:hypothetical protein